MVWFKGEGRPIILGNLYNAQGFLATTLRHLGVFERLGEIKPRKVGHDPPGPAAVAAARAGQSCPRGRCGQGVVGEMRANIDIMISVVKLTELKLNWNVIEIPDTGLRMPKEVKVVLPIIPRQQKHLPEGGGNN